MLLLPHYKAAIIPEFSLYLGKTHEKENSCSLLTEKQKRCDKCNTNRRNQCLEESVKNKTITNKDLAIAQTQFVETVLKLQNKT